MERPRIPPFGIRMPDDLKAWVMQTAQEEGRSANNLIVRILRAKMVAAGADFGERAPAAETATENSRPEAV